MLNKKGGVMLYGIMVSLVIIILALALAPAVAESTNGARNETTGDLIGLDCDNESISNFDKATCVATDLTLFYFISALIFIGGAILISRIVFS